MNPGLKSSARVEAGGIPIPLFERGLFAPFSFNCAQAKASLASGNSLTAYSDLIVLPPTTDIPTRPRAADSITPDLRHQRILFLRHLPPG